MSGEGPLTDSRLDLGRNHMPRRKMLTDRQRAALLDLPTEETAMLQHYTLADDDLEISSPRNPLTKRRVPMIIEVSER